MSGDTIAMLVKFLPTILALIIIILCTLGGLIRGFRKSLILFIHYIISIVAGLVIYFQASKIMLSDGINNILTSISPDFSEANSLYDAVRILLDSYLPDYSGAAANPYIEQAIMAFVGLGVSFALGIVCLVLIPLIIRFLLYILYLLFYREGKIKREKLAEGDDYNPHRLLGMVIGAVRGVVCALLIVSIVSSAFFVLSGGAVEEDKEPAENILILDNLSNNVGFDLNALYKGLKESRATGIGKIFDAILIDGKPVDLYYSDLFLSSNVQTFEKEDNKVSQTNAYLSSSEAVKGEMAKLSIREEMALIVGLLEDVMELNAIKIENGEVIVDYDTLQESLGQMVTEYVNGSVLISEISPLAIIGLAESINDGSIQISDELKELFSDEVVEDIKKIDIPADIAEILCVCINAVDIIPVSEETGTFDFKAFNDKNTYFNFDTELVKKIFKDLSEIETLTKVVFPVGVGIALDKMNDTIKASGINAEELNFTELDWSLEIENIGLIYEKVVLLELDITEVMDSSVNPKTGLANNLEYILDLCNSKELVEDKEKSEIFKEKLLALVDTVFTSDLFSQVGLVYAKSQIAKLEFLDENGNSTPFNDALNLVKENLNYYKEENLRRDLHQLVSSCLGVTSLVPLFISGEINIFEVLYNLDVEDLRSSLLGTYSLDSNGNKKYESGLYSVELLNGSFAPEAKYAIDPLIEGALKTFASEIVSTESVDSVTTIAGVKLNPTDANYDFDAWPIELAALVDAIEELQTVEDLDSIDFNAENIADILPQSIDNNDIDTITHAASKSILLSGIIKEKLVTRIKDDPTIGYAADDDSIVWMDTLENDQYENGELNALLKAFVIFSDNNKAIDLNNNDSLINGLARLLHPSEVGDTYINHDLDYQEVVTFTNSQVLMTILSTEITKLGDSEASGMKIIVPYSLNTKGNEEAWKDWAYDSNGNRMEGEFAKLVLVLYHARKYVEDTTNPADLPKDSTVPILTENNLIHSVIYMEKDSFVVDSKVLHASMSDAIFKQVKDGSVVRVRSIAQENNPSLNPEAVSDYNAIKKDELDKALDTIRHMELEFKDNDFSDINLAKVLEAIKPLDNTSTEQKRAKEARKSICVSNVFNISAVTKITDNSLISVPNGYFEDTNSSGSYDIKDNLDINVWYPTSEDNWEDCELNKMLESIVALNVEANDDNTLNLPEDPTEFLMMLDEGIVDTIYQSKLFSYTMTNKIDNSVNEIREEAYMPDDKFGNKIIDKDEILYLIDFLDLTNIKVDDTSASAIFAAIKDPNTGAKAREMIVKSNILNINFVNEVVESGSLSIPSKYKDSLNNNDIYDVDWYPTAVENWSDCEVARLLNSVVLLDISTEGEGENETINVPSPDVVLDKFSDEDTLNGVYSSDVLALTITDEIDKVDEIHSRDIAHVDGNKENAFKLSEIKLLVDFVNLTGISVDNHDLDAEHIFGSSEDVPAEDRVEGILHSANGDEVRRMLVQSNILNASMVYNISGDNEGDLPDDYFLSLPKAYFYSGTRTINPEAPWYYVDNESTTDIEWENGELYQLLTSMVEIEIRANKNTFYFDIEHIIDDLRSKSTTSTIEEDTKLDVVYHSDVLAKTISDRIYELGKIPEYIYIDSTDEVKSIYDIEGNRTRDDKIILENEVETLLTGLNSLGLSFNGGDGSNNGELDLSHIEETPIATLKANMDSLLDSSILHYIISNKLIDQTQTVNGNSYGIVVKEYWSDSTISSPDIKVVKEYGEGACVYVCNDHITNAINTLSIMGVENIDEVSSMSNTTTLTQYMANATLACGGNKDKAIEAVVSSAITAKIFSTVFIAEGLAVTRPLQEVVVVSTGLTEQALSIVDIESMLSAI